MILLGYITRTSPWQTRRNKVTLAAISLKRFFNFMASDRLIARSTASCDLLIIDNHSIEDSILRVLLLCFLFNIFRTW